MPGLKPATVLGPLGVTRTQITILLSLCVCVSLCLCVPVPCWQWKRCIETNRCSRLSWSISIQTFCPTSQCVWVVHSRGMATFARRCCSGRSWTVSASPGQVPQAPKGISQGSRYLQIGSCLPPWPSHGLPGQSQGNKHTGSATSQVSHRARGPGGGDPAWACTEKCKDALSPSDLLGCRSQGCRRSSIAKAVPAPVIGHADSTFPGLPLHPCD